MSAVQNNSVSGYLYKINYLKILNAFCSLKLVSHGNQA